MKPRELAHFLLFLLLTAPAGWGGTKYTVLHSFGTTADGPGVPSGPPILDSAGNVYGNTYSMTFELSPGLNGQWNETILYTFVATDGTPFGTLTLGGAGSLYGTTSGADTNAGVYQLSHGPSGWNYSVVYNDGAGPGVVMDRAGNLYGNIGPGNYFSGGAIGELSPGTSGWIYTDLANLNPTVGYLPPAPPVFDSEGNLYGVTTDGGIVQPKCWTAFGCGVIFKMTPSANGTAWNYDILHHFASSPTDGQSPYGGLVMDSLGNFYGTTLYGGMYNQGTIFKFALTNGHWKKTVLYDFPDWHIGALPDSTLVFDNAGNLYGVAGGGNNGCGPYTCGVVFRLAPLPNGCWKYNVIHKFSGPDGNFPIGIAVDDRGHLFGTTEAGGTYNSGVLFEISQ